MRIHRSPRSSSRRGGTIGNRNIENRNIENHNIENRNIGNHGRDPDVEPTSMDETFTTPDHHTPAWMIHGRCRSLSPTEFFPSDGVGVERARRICADCPVKAECLEYALTYRIDHGVWGGCSERERRRILRQRRLIAAR